MKTRRFFAMSLAVAAMTFASCQREDVSKVEGTPVSFHVTASTDGTRSVFGDKVEGAYPVLWTTNKQVAFTCDGENLEYATPDVMSDGAKAEFSFEAVVPDGSTTGVLYGFSPKGVYDKSVAENNIPGFTGFNSYYPDEIYLNIPSEQTPLANSCDESAQALFGMQSYDISNQTINMTFNHVVAYGKMAITNFSKEVKSVSITFPVNVFGSSCYYYYKGEEAGKIGGMKSATLTLNPENVVDNVFWFACAPTAGTSGQMKVIVTDSDDKTYTKTINLGTKALPFNQGKVSSFSVNMSGIAADVPPVVETPVYTLLFDKLTTGTNYNSYTAIHSITCDDINWNLYGNQSIGNYLRVGGKNTTATDRTLTSTSAMPAKVNKVVIEHEGIGNGKDSQITVNSISLKVSSTTSFADPIETITLTNPSVASAGDLEFVPSSTEWPAGSFYQVVVNYQISGSNNSYIVIDNVSFYGEASSIPEPTYYTIDVNPTTNGIVILSNEQAEAGETITVTATPAVGYALTSVTVTDAQGGNVAVNNMEFTMPASDVTISVVFSVEGDDGYTWPNPVTFNFGELLSLEEWTNSYLAHTAEYKECTVTFSSANKQANTITDAPVTKGQPVTVVMKGGKKIKSLELVCKKWAAKKQTITLNISKDGGLTYTKTDIASDDFDLVATELESGVNAVEFTFSNSSNQVGIASLTIKYE